MKAENVIIFNHFYQVSIGKWFLSSYGRSFVGGYKSLCYIGCTDNNHHHKTSYSRIYTCVVNNNCFLFTFNIKQLPRRILKVSKIVAQINDFFAVLWVFEDALQMHFCTNNHFVASLSLKLALFFMFDCNA